MGISDKDKAIEMYIVSENNTLVDLLGYECSLNPVRMNIQSLLYCLGVSKCKNYTCVFSSVVLYCS